MKCGKFLNVKLSPAKQFCPVADTFAVICREIQQGTEIDITNKKQKQDFRIK